MYDDFSHSCNVSCLDLRALQLSFILKKGLRTCFYVHINKLDSGIYEAEATIDSPEKEEENEGQKLELMEIHS